MPLGGGAKNGQSTRDVARGRSSGGISGNLKQVWVILPMVVMSKPCFLEYTNVIDIGV